MAVLGSVAVPLVAWAADAATGSESMASALAPVAGAGGGLYVVLRILALLDKTAELADEGLDLVRRGGIRFSIEPVDQDRDAAERPR